MNIESPKQGGPENQSEGVEERLVAFIEEHPEYADRDFSQKEIHQAAELISGKDFSADEDVIRRALDARLSVRETGEKVPVIDNYGRVVGMAENKEDAKRIVSEDSRTHDSM